MNNNITLEDKIRQVKQVLDMPLNPVNRAFWIKRLEELEKEKLSL